MMNVYNPVWDCERGFYVPTIKDSGLSEAFLKHIGALTCNKCKRVNKITALKYKPNNKPFGWPSSESIELRCIYCGGGNALIRVEELNSKKREFDKLSDPYSIFK